MRNRPKKCKTCKHRDSDPAKDPCFTCVDADAYKRDSEAAAKEIAAWSRSQRCSGGRYSYCAPFEHAIDEATPEITEEVATCKTV